MEAEMTMVVGGARSGKSTFAQETASSYGMRVAYLATAEAGDGEMRRRIEKHRTSRPAEWETLELWGPSGLRAPAEAMECALLDCFTVLLANLMAAHGLDWPVADEMAMPEEDVLGRMLAVEEEALALVDGIRTRCRKLSSSATKWGWAWCRLTGWDGYSGTWREGSTSAWRRSSDEVYTVIAGLPLCLKRERKD